MMRLWACYQISFFLKSWAIPWSDRSSQSGGSNRLSRQSARAVKQFERLSAIRISCEAASTGTNRNPCACRSRAELAARLEHP